MHVYVYRQKNTYVSIQTVVIFILYVQNIYI